MWVLERDNGEFERANADCRVLPIVPSTCYERKAKQSDPSLRSDRA